MLPGSIAFFGASSVYGIGDPEQGGYVQRVRQWYDKKRINGVIYNLGIPAENTNFLVKRFSQEVSRRNPELSVLHIGANDAFRKGSETAPHAVSIEQFAKNVEFLIEKGKKLGNVALLTPVPVDETCNPHGFPNEKKDGYYLNLDIEEYLSVLRQIVASTKTKCIDLWDEWQGLENEGELLARDGLHLSIAGHEKVARSVIRFLAIDYSLDE